MKCKGEISLDGLCLLVAKGGGYLFLQLGGPDGELAAATRYLNQRYTMPYKECKGILTDIGMTLML